MAEEKVERTPEEIAATVAKLKAEAEQARAEARKANAEAEDFELAFEINKIGAAKIRESELIRDNDDFHRRVYRFLGTVRDESVKKAIDTLTIWSRIDPGCPITFVIDSPGGGIIEGFHLFDVLRHLSDAKGHEITTIALGYAASMGGVLLQAGDTRVMGPRSALLIHEASFGAGGSMGTVEDHIEFIKKLQDRILDIFAERSKMSKTQIKNKWARKDWWLMADEALKHGFCDFVR